MPGLPTAGAHSFAPLAEGDAAPAVRLLARAYAGESTARCFAPNARLDEWAQYLGQTLSTPGVGRFLPDASFIAKDNVAAQGQVVTTEIARGVAHVAQVAVDPGARRQGLARRLVLAAGAAAAGQDAKRVTLIVSEDNASARGLYASLGFVPRGEFIFGHRGPVPRHVGGVTIRASAAA